MLIVSSFAGREQQHATQHNSAETQQQPTCSRPAEAQQPIHEAACSHICCCCCAITHCAAKGLKRRLRKRVCWVSALLADALLLLATFACYPGSAFGVHALCNGREAAGHLQNKQADDTTMTTAAVQQNGAF
jgi:hypothetical protein